MEFRIFFRHMDSSLAVYAYAEARLATLADKFGPHLQGLNLTVDATDDGFDASAQVTGPGYATHFAAHDGVSLHAAIDALEDKIGSALARRKNRHLAVRHRDGIAVIGGAAPSAPSAPEESVDAAEILAFERARRRFTQRIGKH